MPDKVWCDLERCSFNSAGVCCLPVSIDLIANKDTEAEWPQPYYLVCNSYEEKE